ncbi:MAG TPA: choice-of-anchor B family protein [Bacteroidota bacterium]|nr:choice-of-anchor B family protein [Bacteroidota bacterium]
MALKFNFFFVVWILILLNVDILSTQTNEVSLIGNINEPHGTSPQGTQYSACWGWVSPDGREYALLSTCEGTSIIDLNSDSLREIQFIPGPGPVSWCYREIKTYKHYAYIVSEAGGGVQIVDLSGLPDTAILLKSFIYTDTSSGKHNTYSHTVTMADGYLYCNGTAAWSPGGAVIFSLRNDPTNPEFVGTYAPRYLHDTYARNDTLYGAAIGSGGGLYIVDVKDKTNPILLGKISYDGSGTHNAWASIDGKYAFTTDEIGTTAHNLKVWDISNLPTYTMVASYSANPNHVIHNIRGRGNYAYIAHYKEGIRVVDIHDPITPFEVGSYDTDTLEIGTYSGCWDVYPYFPSGKIIGSDMRTGLYVCKFDSLIPRTHPRLLEPAESVMTASPLFRWTSAANQKEDPHYYEIHILGSDVDTVFKSFDTTFNLTSTNFLTDAALYSWSVKILDEYTEVSSQDTFHFTYIGPLDVSEDRGIIQSFSLKQNYPNPFNPMTSIEFAIPVNSEVTVKVYNLLGEEVSSLLQNRYLIAGNHQIVFNASGLPSGVYFYRLITTKFIETKKLVVSR